ncbi:hypothetical protein ANTRET_LOCUS514 [Anthophora retusa]
MTKYAVAGKEIYYVQANHLYVCTNRSLRAGRRRCRRHRRRCTSSCACIPPTREPFLVDVWVEDTHGRRKQRIMLNCQANFASSQFMLTCPDVLAIFPSSPNWHVMLDCIILQNFLHTAELLCTRETTRR